MEISEERIEAAYAVADGKQKKVLDALFGKEEPKENRPVTERVKTFEDAMNELGENHLYVKSYRQATRDENLVQYCRLRIITAALNEGWQPQFTKGERRYWPYFFIYKDKDAVKRYADPNEKIKPLPESVRCVVWGGYTNPCAIDGFAGAHSDYAPSFASTDVGSRLCFKSRELAEYAADVFAEEWLKYYIL